MFRSDRPENYEEVYRGLVTRLREVDFAAVAPGLGTTTAPAGVALDLPFFSFLYRVNRDGVSTAAGGATPDVAHRIVACYYVLHAGCGELSGEWVSYRDFRDSQFFMPAFRASAEEKIARAFEGRKNELPARAAALGGAPFAGPVDADASFRFAALPRIPLLLLFNDADEDFPADARILFDRNAHLWLDMECLAVTGIILAELLSET